MNILESESKNINTMFQEEPKRKVGRPKKKKEVSARDKHWYFPISREELNRRRYKSWKKASKAVGLIEEKSKKRKRRKKNEKGQT